jgi:hypothetical protein
MGRTLGKDIILVGEDGECVIFARDAKDKRVLSLSRTRHTITVYSSQYLAQAEEIARGYEEMIEKDVTLQTDYSQVERESA